MSPVHAFDQAPIPHRRPVHLVVMGVSANGKTSVGRQLAETFEAVFIEGDELHPAENIEKMSSGTPLTDEDRWPWLERIVELTTRHAEAGSSTVVACSALRRTYRDLLRRTAGTFFVHLHGDFDLLTKRIRERRGHFMPPALLRSQFDTLEPLEADEAGATVDVAPPIEQVAEAAARAVRSGLRLG